MTIFDWLLAHEHHTLHFERENGGTAAVRCASLHTLDEPDPHNLRFQLPPADQGPASGLREALLHIYDLTMAEGMPPRLDIREVARAALSQEPAPSGLDATHGRHCRCSACAREDWTNPNLAPCGMHGPSCPPLYAPLAALAEPES